MRRNLRKSENGALTLPKTSIPQYKPIRDFAVANDRNAFKYSDKGDTMSDQTNRLID